MTVMSKVLERFLATDTGREIAQTVEVEDIEARQARVQEITDARRWETVERDRLAALRRDATGRCTAAREAFDEATATVAEIDRQMRWTGREATRRADIATAALRATAPPRLDDVAAALVELIESARNEFSSWSFVAEEWHGPRLRFGTNRDEVAAVSAAITTARRQVEELRLAALTGDELAVRLRQIRGAVQAAARENGITLTWPAEGGRG